DLPFPRSHSLAATLNLSMRPCLVSSRLTLLPFYDSSCLFSSYGLFCYYIFEFQKRREEDAAAVFCFVVLIVYSLVSGPG
ncbi:hypothetical protein B0H14DRAFT_2861115, partial [Mycena olivaceomarginata]